MRSLIFLLLVFPQIVAAQAACPVVAKWSDPQNTTLTGTAPTLDEAGGAVVVPLTFNVYRSTVSGSEAAPPLVAVLTSPSYVDSAVIRGVTYYYTMTAVNINGESVMSLEACKSFLQAPPKAPTSLVAK